MACALLRNWDKAGACRVAHHDTWSPIALNGSSKWFKLATAAYSLLLYAGPQPVSGGDRWLGALLVLAGLVVAAGSLGLGLH
jgi:hypothetical protein